MFLLKLKRRAWPLALGAATMTTVHADTIGAGVPTLPTYQQECAACHMAFPPALLPASSWQRIMVSLRQHYGTDASLDEASVREIGVWLKSNAGTYKRVTQPPPHDRITLSDWFVRKHQERKVPAAVWKRPSVASPANCVACHGNAAQGSFSEHEIRIPK